MRMINEFSIDFYYNFGYFSETVSWRLRNGIVVVVVVDEVVVVVGVGVFENKQIGFRKSS